MASRPRQHLFIQHTTIKSIHISTSKMLIPRVLLGDLAAAAVAVDTMPTANPGPSLSTFVWPRCGRNRLTMPYHGGVYCQAYQNTDYARLGCNHDAGVSEMDAPCLCTQAQGRARQAALVLSPHGAPAKAPVYWRHCVGGADGDAGMGR